MPDRLQRYRDKRDFDKTPEPTDEPSVAPRDSLTARREGDASERGMRFVVQEHSARSMHWDLRLEHDGALASWAVPRGIPPDPKKNHLAVRTEDHPLEYLEFHGEIPEGEYGAGTMRIYDRGTFDVEKWRPDEVMVVFHGERVRGRYVLFRTDEKNWMIHRMDPPEDPDREPMPSKVEPMLAKSGPLPKGANWAYEIKWDGVRAIGYVDGGRLRLESRNSKNITPRYPELRPLGRALGTHEAILDGEIVAFGDDGRPSFERLQGRMHLTSESQVRRLSQSRPVAYVIFDLLYLDGRSLLELPYLERREKLASLELNGPTWQVPAYHQGDGSALLEASRAQRLEGIVAKRADSPYVPGRRTPAWVKVKNVQRTDVVIGGWLKGDGGRAGRLGALAMGVFEDDGLRFVGKVGTGFTDAELKRLQGLLEPLERDTSPFAGTQPPKLTRFVEPVLVASVEYTDITRIGTIRHPSYKGLRDDVDPHDVAIERADVG